MHWLHRVIEPVKFFHGISRRAEAVYAILARMYREPLLAAEKQADPRTLTAYGFTAYSQAEEDGMIQEIFRRIGTTEKRFVEFGCGDGLENNTTYLLLTGWSGLWLGGSRSNMEIVNKEFTSYLRSGRLRVTQTFLTRDNINGLLAETGFSGEIDLLSIDIDGNDYWLWEALEAVRPRVVIIEYNAVFRPPQKLVQPYGQNYVWNSSNYFGASLKALEKLGTRKGFCLVGCSFASMNALFVRQDLVAGLFSEPFTAEHHYREPHYDAFVRGYSRHRRAVGEYQMM